MNSPSSSTQKFVVFDLEATAMSADYGRIIEIALIVLEKGPSGIEIIDSYQSLVRPDAPVPKAIYQLTGIKKEELESAPRFVDIAQTIELYTREATLIAHGAKRDFELLRAHFESVGIDYPRRYQCTQLLAKHNDPKCGAYDLKSLCLLYDIELKEQHRALPDALACAALFMRLEGTQGRNLNIHQEIILKFLRRFPQLKWSDLKELAQSPALVFLYQQKRIVAIHPFEAGRLDAVKLLSKLPIDSFERVSVKAYDHYLLALIDSLKLKKRFRPKLELVGQDQVGPEASYPWRHFALEFEDWSLIFRDDKLQGKKRGEDYFQIYETKAIRRGILTYLRNSRNAKVRHYQIRTLKSAS